MTSAADKRLDKLIADAPKELTPAESNWDAIAARLDRPQPTKAGEDRKENRPGRLPWYVTTAVAAALLLTLVPQLPIHNTPEVDNSLWPLIESIDLAHRQEVASLAESSSNAWQQVGYQEPVEAGLKELREAARLILSSLKANPQDKQLWQLWLWVQRREIELLTQGQRLPAGATQGDTL
ncbi:hypothetical protein SHAM105786_05010 [Shewanella amazonensis]|uniref:Uncharacterized protein n=1 Tax=Shewanella amazonensis (strain ATCC BAA-1098 / SB2B) TaxID=326297 RepID=A1S8V8_SHEAM|nr:hypothetical protein [Shewanella amazonensis]ABM00815.1 conserved hypothetical protein [Shewanella amazonensis SB2B]